MSSDPPTNQSNTCVDVQPWLAAYALGETDADPAMLAHLQACSRCQRDLREYRRVAGSLPYDAPLAAPSAALRERVIAAIAELAEDAAPAEERAAPARPPVAPTRPRRQIRRPFGFWGALAGVAAVLVALLGWNIALQRQSAEQADQVAFHRRSWQTMIALLNDPALRWYPIAGETARGHLWATPQGQDACLVIQNLPELAADQEYQVWLARGGQQASGGVFEAHNGNAWIIVHSDWALAQYDTMFVTIEPRGGAAWPSGPRVLNGVLTTPRPPASADRQQLLRLALQAVE
jgi:anti-sigma-K factor RskA